MTTPAVARAASALPLATVRSSRRLRTAMRGVLAAATLAAGAVEAQTTTLIDQSLTAPVTAQTLEVDVTSSGGALFIVGSGIFNPDLKGSGVLSGPNNYLKVFALTNGTTGVDVFNIYTLPGPGTYTFTYSFANSTGQPGDRFAFAATVTQLAPANLCAAVTCAPGGGTCDPSSGSCVCPSGQTLCESVCTDTTSDIFNCGGCGIVCPNNDRTPQCIDSVCD